MSPEAKAFITSEGTWLFLGSATTTESHERIFACGSGCVATAAGFNTEAIAIHPESSVYATHSDARIIRAVYTAATL